MTLGLKDQIYDGKSPRSIQSGHHSRMVASGKKGYPNIFSSRTLVPSDHEGLTSPKGSMMRQENYLEKMKSEKRNMLSMKKFANSGHGLDHKHPFFVRKTVD